MGIGVLGGRWRSAATHRLRGTVIACDPAHNGQSRPEVSFTTPAKMKRFSLFSVQRWLSPGATAGVGSCPGQRPPCSSHVGTLGVCTRSGSVATAPDGGPRSTSYSSSWVMNPGCQVGPSHVRGPVGPTQWPFQSCQDRSPSGGSRLRGRGHAMQTGAAWASGSWSRTRHGAITQRPAGPRQVPHDPVRARGPGSRYRRGLVDSVQEEGNQMAEPGPGAVAATRLTCTSKSLSKMHRKLSYRHL